MTFLIVGRPRSRTAWVANFLSVPPASLCLHEGLADAKLDYDRLRARMDALPAQQVGCADTGFIHAVGKMMSTWPDAQVVVMMNAYESWERWRPRSAIREAVDRDFDYAVEALQGYAYFCDAQQVTRDVDEARRLWTHCLQTVPFCTERWRILKDMNVQVQLDSLPRRYNT